MTDQRQNELREANQHPLNQQAARLLKEAGEQEMEGTLHLMTLAWLAAFKDAPETRADSPDSIMLANLEAEQNPKQILTLLEALLKEYQPEDELLPDNAMEAGEMILSLLRPDPAQD